MGKNLLKKLIDNRITFSKAFVNLLTGFFAKFFIQKGKTNP